MARRATGSRKGENNIVHTYSPKCLKAMNMTPRTILECYSSPKSLLRASLLLGRSLGTAVSC